MSDDPTKVRIRRILVAMDASPHSQSALQAAIELATHTGANLAGIFVEDENLLRMGNLSFTREIRLFSTAVAACSADDIQRQLRVQRRRAEELVHAAARRAGVSSTFRTVRGQVEKEILAACSNADVVALGRQSYSNSGAKKLGSTAQALLQQASVPVMVLPEEAQLRAPVMVLYDGSKAANQALLLAAQITKQTQYTPLSVVNLAATPDKAGPLEKEVLQLLQPHKLHVSFYSIGRFSAQRLLHLLETHQSGLIISPAALGTANEQQQLLKTITSPVILVH